MNPLERPSSRSPLPIRFAEGDGLEGRNPGVLLHHQECRRPRQVKRVRHQQEAGALCGRGRLFSGRVRRNGFAPLAQGAQTNWLAPPQRANSPLKRACPAAARRGIWDLRGCNIQYGADMTMDRTNYPGVPEDLPVTATVSAVSGAQPKMNLVEEGGRFYAGHVAVRSSGGLPDV